MGIIKKNSKSGIGAFSFFCIGFGAIVGVGWAVSINRWMANCGGPIPAGSGYIVALFMMIPVALCYCELCPMLPVAGGGAAYGYKAFGEKISFISGWAAFGGFVTIIPWEAIYIVDTLAILFPGLTAGDPLYSLAGADIYLGHIILGTAFSCVLFAINWRGLSTSAGLQRILCILLIGAGVLAMIASLINFDADNYQPVYEAIPGHGSHDNFRGGMLAILASAPFFLAGFETIPQGIEDAGGNVKSVGKTVVLSVGLACVFYAILLFSLGGAYPWQDFCELPTPAASNLFLNIYEGTTGVLLYYIILIGAVCGLLTTWNSFLGASPRLMMCMARANMIPQFFAKQNQKNGVPTNGLIVCFLLSLVGPFLGMGLIDPLTSFSAAGFVLSWLITSVCLVRLRKTEPEMNRPYKVPGGAATGVFAALMMSTLFILLFIPGNPVFMGNTAVSLFLAWMIVGAALFFASAKQRAALSPEERAAALFARMDD